MSNAFNQYLQARYTELLEDIAPFIRDYYTKGPYHIDTRTKAAELRRTLSLSASARKRFRLKFENELDSALMALLGLKYPEPESPTSPAAVVVQSLSLV